MLKITDQSRILISTSHVDFRKGLDGFIALCQMQLNANPRDGAFFVFRNRARTMVRVLVHDGTGYWLATKRLSSGRFDQWPSGQSPVSDATARDILSWLKTLSPASCQPLIPFPNES